MIDPALWPVLGQFRWRWQAGIARLRWRNAKVFYSAGAFQLIDQETRSFAITADIAADGGCAGRFVAVIDVWVKRPAPLTASGAYEGAIRLAEYVAGVMCRHAAGHHGDLLSLRRHLDHMLRHQGLSGLPGLHCRLQHLRLAPPLTAHRDWRAEITVWLQEELQEESET